jgi:hypothetical protein
MKVAISNVCDKSQSFVSFVPGAFQVVFSHKHRS